MELLYAVLLLHKAGKKVDEANLKKIAEAAGIAVDETKIKALIAALSGVNLDEVIKVAVAPVAAIPSASGVKAEKKIEKKEEAKVEDASVGLSALFG
ncbi:MAG: 50S ribosomal protein L12 [Nanoarchaeota archaeon]